MTLQMPQVLPVFGYTATNAFGNLNFTNPVAIVSPPGETNRLFIVEQAGRIIVITNLANPTRTVFLDATGQVYTSSGDEEGLLGMAFHPGYAANGFFYIFFTDYTNSAAGVGRHDELARYKVSAANPNQADPTSKLPLIVQYDEAPNHNAGDLHFGPDGYLYVSLGDEGGENDLYNNSQRIDKDFFSGILRIDVDKRPGNLAPNPHVASSSNYSVPSDNPFVGATSFNGSSVNPAQVRTEFWAVGLRNPWRFSFDPATGFLYCGDAGQDAREEIDIITKGGNYGWAYREGSLAGPKIPPQNFSSIDPIQDYGHGTGTNQGYVVIGGIVCHSLALSQLDGAYIFADDAIGNVWALRYDGTNTIPFQRLFGEIGITCFGVDPRNGDVLMGNLNSDNIRRLVYSSGSSGPPLPPTLADTGVFSNLTTLATQPGIVPYDVNASFWSDNALKSRWFSIPATNQTIGFDREANWWFPTGTVWIKHFELELTNGVPASRKRLETRLLVKNSTGVYGVTYRWGNSLTNATLVPEEGMDEALAIDDGGGVVRTQVWHYPSRQECLVCHTAKAGYALGCNTAQLNRDFNYGGATTNQIAALNLAGYFNTNVTGIHTLRALADPADPAVSVEYRVRSYLAANCVQCHQPGTTVQALWDARLTTQTPWTGIIDGALMNNQGNTNNRVIKSGSLANSMLLTRISMRGPGQMPPLASTVVNTQNVALVSEWITNELPEYQSYQDWQMASFGSTNAPGSAPMDDADADSAGNYLEFLTGTDPLVWTANLWKINLQRAGNAMQIVFPQLENRGFEVQWATGLTAAATWTPLDQPGNEPFFASTNFTAQISDPLSNSNRFYRVRVFAP